MNGGLRPAIAIAALLTTSLALGATRLDVFFLAVGNRDYRLVSETARVQGIEGFGKISGGVDSARLVARTLRNGGARGGTVLVSESGRFITKGDVEGAIDHLIDSARRAGAPRPLLVFYLVGHGVSEGVGWNHFTVPGDFAGRIDLHDPSGLAKTMLWAGDLYDRLEASGLPFMIMLDTCYEGDQATLPPGVLSAMAEKNLGDAFAVLRHVNEFHEPNPVVFATRPGTVVPVVAQPGADESAPSIGPLARRMVLVVGHAKEQGTSLSLGDFLAGMTSAALDRDTKPALTYTTALDGDDILIPAAPIMGPEPEERVGGSRPRAVPEDEGVAPPPPEPPDQASAAPGSTVSIASEPGEFVGNGKTWRVDGSRVKIELVERGPDFASFQFDRGNGSWTIEFIAPNKQPLVARRYAHAQRAGFEEPGRPGFSASGEGRACNEVAANFDVTELSRTSDGRIGRFAADFEQHCDGDARALRGGVRFVADRR